MSTRLVRRAPLLERIKAYLNPLDLLLWLYEEIDSSDWDQFQRSYATAIGLALNVVFVVARASGGGSGRRRRSGADDVFGDEDGGMLTVTGWLGWLASFTTHLLTLFSLLNALYTFQRKRHYRLFQTSVDTAPRTPSAHRVRVDSSPRSSASPLRFLAQMLASSSAEARAHPDPGRDVWELGVWDPLPLCVRLFCLFSPGHVVLYGLLLPPPASDVRPSTTVVTAGLLGALLALQLHLLQGRFRQQGQDTALIQQEVLHEYDAKFVHPRLHPLVRDVGTQYDVALLLPGPFSPATHPAGPPSSPNFVCTYTPAVVVNKGFQTHPNPRYAADLDRDGYGPERVGAQRRSRFQTPTLSSHHRPPPPPPALDVPSSATTSHTIPSSPLRPPPPSTTIRQPYFHLGKTHPGKTHPGTATSTTGSDGGSLGVYTHANSPLRKPAAATTTTTSTTTQSRSATSDAHQRLHHHPPQHHPSRSSASANATARREGSPLKNSILPPPASRPYPGYPSWQHSYEYE
ncbi:MAG: hypothetical protein M1826_004513 [Phylliscum demangeonii]|nr:MAG: hypothetical protein M1826_004513 [Phylliscum demangeonii]